MGGRSLALAGQGRTLHDGMLGRTSTIHETAPERQIRRDSHPELRIGGRFVPGPGLQPAKNNRFGLDRSSPNTEETDASLQQPRVEPASSARGVKRARRAAGVERFPLPIFDLRLSRLRAFFA